MHNKQIPVQSNPLPSSPGPVSTDDALSNEMHEAALAEFGPNPPAEVFPSKFFDHGDKTISPDGRVQARGPKNCATPYGAARLVQVLGPAKVLMGNPGIFDGLAGSFGDTNLVPWLVFTGSRADSPPSEGRPINAGTLLDFFNHGYPGKQARHDAEVEIEASFQPLQV